MGLFRRLRYLENALAVHLRDHDWQALEKRTTALEKLALDRLREKAEEKVKEEQERADSTEDAPGRYL